MRHSLNNVSTNLPTPIMRPALAWALFGLALLLVLGGCSSMRVIDSDVTAFATWTAAPPGPGTPYRFERLPSQQLAGHQQDAMEELARASLAKVGMTLSPTTARFSVQVVLTTQVQERFADNGFLLGGPGVFLGAGNLGSSIGFSFPIRSGETVYKRDLLILVRELSSQRVVFETRALHDGPWRDSAALAPAMLDAALLGFPQPPAGTRRINVEIAR